MREKETAIDRRGNEGGEAVQGRRRVWRLAPLLGLGVLAVFGLVLWSGAAEPRAPAELASSQWQRLVQGITRAAQEARREWPGKPVLTAAAAAPAPSIPSSARQPSPAVEPALLARQAAEYAARRPKTIVELQQFRSTDRSPIADPRGRTGTAQLVNLNPRSNFWYLLELDWAGEVRASYHLSNAHPETQRLRLDPGFPGGLVLESSAGRERCELWANDSPGSLAAAVRERSPYVTLCDEQLAVRRPTAGRRTSLEWATDFLRDNVWGGESLTVLVRDNLYRDAQLLTSEAIAGAPHLEAGAVGTDFPRPAAVDLSHAADLLAPLGLGLALEVPRPRARVGAWYPARDNPGVFVSVFEPGLVAASLLASSPRLAGGLDAVEAKALAYLVAFDLSRFELDFSVGTDHPRVGWSDRVRPESRDNALPGPDGIANIAPLVAGGIIPHSLAPRAVASFTGGFKRSHGGFRSGALANTGFGSHYGFIESGVVLSKLQPGLATIFGLDDGTVAMKTWSKDDDTLLERIRFARQNGVPIVETDVESGAAVPGALVNRWGDGNWSGSEDHRLRSVRAGICLQESATGRFLLYGYFSSATPTAMARVFQAYGCAYAMITDMNALEHTYLALYRVEESRLEIDHLITGMSVLDKIVDGQVLPRFLGFADNRDFFYVVRRAPRGEG